MLRLLAERAKRFVRLHRGELATVAAILVFGLALRVAWIALSDARPVGADTHWYHTVAQGFAEGKGIGNADDLSIPTALFPPGYPVALGIAYRVFGHGLWVGQALNVFASLGTIVLIYVIARMEFDKTTAASGALVFAVLPSQAMFPQLLVSEPLFTLMLTAIVGMLLMAHRGPPERAAHLLTTAGLLAGAAALVRSQAIVLIPVVTVWWVASHRTRSIAQLTPALLFVVAVAAVVLPWTARNWAQMGSPPVLVSSNLGWDAVIGHNPNADGGWNQPGNYFLDTIETPLPQRETEINEKGIRRAWDYARSHPRREISLSVKKAYRLWRTDDDAVWWQEIGMKPYLSETERSTMRYICNGAYYGAVLLMALGLAVSWRRARPFWVFAMVLVAGWTASHAVIFTENRFHYPLLPLLAIGAGAGLAAIIDFVRMRAIGQR
jgi:4-amino-4-deoxy-L-arabinose transferase-like glycosyltransferase